MEFLLLGPVQARIGERPVSLGVRKQRFVLAVLALEVNRLVTVDRLIDLTWPDGPPATARGIVHTTVSRLRARLATSGAVEHGVALGSDGPGYVLTCDPARIDAHRFRDLLGRARDCAEESARLALLDEALALWRGPALAGTADEPTRRKLCHHLEEARLTATEDRFDALLRLGRPGGVIDELTSLTADHPDRHRFTAQLMVALHHAGRTAEALEAYRATRRRLVDEFGIDPPAELRQLQTAILRNDPAVAAPSGAPERPELPRPAQLPPDLHTFTGRTDELAELLDRLDVEAPVVISAVDGMAGVGKTALAVHAAHRLAGDYPDAQLFIDLHGFTPDLEPVAPGEALDRLLRALGVPANLIPANTEDRTALFRSRLAGMRALILLDNAADEAQVTALLPGTPGCLVLVTSRRRLTGLQHARPISLDVLPLPDAATLFTRVAGPERLAGEPADAVVTVVELCGRLPLALQAAAGRLRARPAWTLGHLAERLREQRRRMTELETGQPGVLAAFDLSYRHLAPDQQRLFRMLGVHPGADLDAHAAAALAGITAHEAGRLLDDLVEVHLLAEHSCGRYALHDLLRAHAAWHLADAEPAARRREALTRLLDHYLRTATVGADLLDRHRRRLPEPLPAEPGTGPELTSYEHAMTWLQAERVNLLAAVVAAARNGLHAHAWRLAHALSTFYEVRGHIDDWITSHRLAVDAARAAGDRFGEAETLNHLGTAHLVRGDNAEALACYRLALPIWSELGDRRGEAATSSNLGMVYGRLGDYAKALAHQQHALSVLDGADARVEANAVANLATLNHRFGDLPLALDHSLRALELFRRLGDRRRVAGTLCNLGDMYGRLDRHDEALDHLHRALEMFRQLADRRGVAGTLCNLGISYGRLGRRDEAVDHLWQALIAGREVGDLDIERETLGVLRDLGIDTRDQDVITARPGPG